MQPKTLSLIEKLILLLIVMILALGFYFFNTNVPRFETYVQEDGVVEWLTVLGLILGSVTCFYRLFILRKQRKPWFLFVVFIMGLGLFFAAGEEISWGQRIFHIQSSEFFLKNNAQGETNLHNLVVGGLKVNKIVFSIGLVAAMGLYLVFFPLIYKRSASFKRFVDKSGIPIPFAYQVISILVVFALTEMIRHGKRAELLEAGIALLFFLIIYRPLNKEIFSK